MRFLAFLRFPAPEVLSETAWRSGKLAAPLLAATLAACGTTAPPLRWVHLPLDPSPVSTVPAPSSEPASTGRGVNEAVLLQSVRLPEVLDRDELLLPQGPAGLAPLPGWRWAEPLRDAVPRLLRDDLARALGESRVWAAPSPPGLGPQRPLRLEVVLFQAELRQEPPARSVRLRARWTLGDAAPGRPPRSGVFDVSVPVRADGAFAGEPAQALAQAHRDAVAALAKSISEEVKR